MAENLSIINGNAGDAALDATLAGGTIGFADGSATDNVTNGEIGSLTGLIVLQANTTISLAANAAIALRAGATGLKLETKTGDISVLAAITAVNLTLLADETRGSGGKLVIAGSIAATGTVILQSDAGFTLGANGPVTAATLDIGVNTGGVSERFSGILVANVLQSSVGVVGTVNFAGSGNSIAAIGGFAVSGGDFWLTDTGGLGVTGPLTAANVTLSSQTIMVSGSIGATTTLALTAGAGGLVFNAGAILSGATVDLSASGGGGTESALGKIVANLLQSSSGNTGTVSLAGSGNTIATLGSFAVTSGDFLLNNSGNLAVTGWVTAANVKIVSATIAVSGTIGAATDITLTAGVGGLSIAATGIVSAARNGVFNAATTVNDGTIRANSGTLSFGAGHTLTGTGVVTLGAGAKAVIDAGVAASQSVRFLANTGTLTLGAPASFAATILGLVSGDLIDFTGIAPTGVLAVGLAAGNVLSATRDGTVVASVQLDPAQSFAGAFFHATADGAGTGILIAENNIPCFVAGTRILTLTGERRVEDLRAGEQVMSAFGGSTDIVWIGHRQVDCVRHLRPEDVWPVRVDASAFGPDQPSRALFLSPDHAVHVDGVLIPVRYLVNGATIAQVKMAAPLYFHIELRQHDVLFAEGLACESYLDTGNRVAFANAETIMLRPNFDPTAFALDVWQSRACAELVVDGPVLAARKRALLEQAAAIGHVLNDEPGLEVYLDGQALAVVPREGRYEVRVPAWARAVRLLSKIFVPMQVVADNFDTRMLGVAIANITLDGATLTLDDPFLVTGWHAPEATARWTSGDAVLVTGGATVLCFDIVTRGRYWAASSEATRLRA